MVDTPADVVNGAGRAARVQIGKDQHLFFRETDRPQPEFDGHHIAIYVTNFSGPHRRLKERNLVSQEDNRYQYRFRDIVDLDSARPLFTIEHEVRSVSHPMFLRPLVNRNPTQTNRNYAAGYQEHRWRWSRSCTIRWSQTDPIADRNRPAPIGAAAGRELFDAHQRPPILVEAPRTTAPFKVSLLGCRDFVAEFGSPHREWRIVRPPERHAGRHGLHRLEVRLASRRLLRVSTNDTGPSTSSMIATSPGAPTCSVPSFGSG